MKMGSLDDDEKAAMFMQLYNGTFGTQIGLEDARNMMVENVSTPGLLSEGQKKYKSELGMSYMSGDKGRNAWDRYTGSIQDSASGAWYNKFSYASSWFTSAPALWDETGGTANSNRNFSPEVQSVLDSSPDASKVVVLDESGKAVATGKDEVSTWFADRNNYNKFSASGSRYTIRDNGSNSTWNSMNIGGASSTNDVAGANEKNTIYITLSPQAKQWFDTNKDNFTLDDGKN